MCYFDEGFLKLSPKIYDEHVEDGESGKIEFLISVCLGSGGAHLVANNYKIMLSF